MKSKLLFFALLLMGVSAGAQTPISVSISDDCSQNGISKIFATTGSSTVSSTSGRTSCEWVQLWENGPRWATFNVGATIIDYANLTIGADATPFDNYTDQAPYYNTANCGGLYAWKQPNYNGRQTSWSSVSTGVAGVATSLWGSNWKTPTREQLDILQNSSYGKTKWTWCDGSTTQYVPGCTLKGYKVSGVGAYADKSIFLPVAGYFSYSSGTVDDASNGGRYWSSTVDDSDYAYSLRFDSSSRRMAGIDRWLYKPGFSVRAVFVYNNSTSILSLHHTLTLYADGCSSPNTFICSPGQQLSVSATPMVHRHFVAWNDGNTDNPRLVTMNQNLTYTATFAPDSFNISVVASPTSYGSVSGAGRYEYNELATLSATANYGYKFSKWNDDNTRNPRTVTVTEDKTYTAIFEKRNFYLIVKSPDSKYGSVSGWGSYLYQSEQTISASPKYGYHFDSWSDGNTENPRTITMLSDTTFTAVFAPDTFSLTILYNDTMGTVTGAGMYAYGDTANIVSTPNYGYYFYRLLHNGNSYDYQNATLRITKNDTVTIEFEKAEFHVYGQGQNGRINGTGSYLYLDSATITAIPNVGYLFDSWSDGVTDNPRDIQVTGDTTFTALYVMQYEGKCGENLTWQYNNGLLTISGIGNMYHYDYREDYYEAVIRPWRLFRDSIEKVIIEHGVTSIGQSAFHGLQNRAFTKVVMPQSVKSIGYYAFADCNRLTSVVFSNNLEEVGDYAFSGCNRINDMTCYATVTPDAYEHTFGGVNTMAYLYVQAGSARTYKLDPIWGEFDIHEIGAESTTVTGNGVLVEPSDNEAVFTWPMSDGASTYSLAITKNGVVFCTLTFNAEGQLTNIAFAPARGEAANAPAATLTENGYQFTVTGLDYATNYAFSLNAKDAAAQVVASYSGTFHTNGATALEDVQHDGVQIQKILRDGVLYILTPNGTFDATGRRVEE